MKNPRSNHGIVLIRKKPRNRTCIDSSKISWRPFIRRMSKICTCSSYPCCRWLLRIWIWLIITLWWLAGQLLPHMKTWFWIRPINQISITPKWELTTDQSRKRSKISFLSSRITRRSNSLMNWGSRWWISTKSCRPNTCGKPKCWDLTINWNKSAWYNPI